MEIFSYLVEMLLDWPLGTIIGIITLGCILLLVVFVAWGLFVALDSWFLPRGRKMGCVVSKTFIPAHIQLVMMYSAATKTSMPHPIYHSDNWSVNVEVDGQQDSVEVSKDFFNTLSKNDLVLTEYVSGRFSGNLYIKSLFVG